MKLEYDPIRPGDARVGSDVQAPFDDLATISAAFDGENLAPEGFDRRALGSRAAWDLVTSQTVNTRPATSLAASAAFIQLVHDGTALRLTLAPLVVGADEAVRLRSWIRLASSVSAGLGLEGLIRTRWYRDAGGGTLVTGSGGVLERKDRGTWGHARNNHGVLWNEALIVGPITLTWVEIRYTFAASGPAECFPDRSILWLTRHKRWSS